MSFLAPLFLVALAGLAVPVVIHLIQRERRQVVVFPSLMFVRRVPYQSVQRRRIRHWALLLARLGVLALIVVAFARPFVRGGSSAAGPAGAREVVILLDQSYSMAFGDCWARAQAAARDAIDALGPADRGSLVLFAERAAVSLRSTSDRDRLRAAVAAAAPAAGATRFSPALQVAGSILADSPLPRREVVLVSDFQRSGWRGAGTARLPAGAALTPVLVSSDPNARNAAIVAASLARSTFAGQERITITAGVVNRSARALAEVAATLEIDGRAVQTARIALDAGGSGSVAFDPVTVGRQPMRATVRLPADALEPDNAFHLVLRPPAPVEAVVLEREGAPETSSLYLVRALSISDDPRIDVTRRTGGTLSDEDLRRASVVIVNDAPVSAGLAPRLRRFVESGGGLFMVLGPRASWPPEQPLLPFAPGPPVDRSRGDAARLGAIEYGHPVFELFRAPRSGDFSAARFFGYRGLSTPAAAPAAAGTASDVLARFDSGAPALVARAAGRGRVLMWASTLDLTWSDLPLKPIFLPFLHRAVRYLSAYVTPPPWSTVGQVVDPSRVRAESGEPRLAVTPSGRSVPLDDEGSDVLELEEPGFYEIRGQPTDQRPDVVAVNVDARESDLTAMDGRELAASATGSAGASGSAGAVADVTPDAQERAQRTWWYLLWAGLALLGVESMLAARASRTT